MKTLTPEQYRHVLQLIDRLATIGRHVTKPLSSTERQNTIVAAEHVEQVNFKNIDNTVYTNHLEQIETQESSSDSQTSSELTDAR